MATTTRKSPGIQKLQGVHYTPKLLAQFVAERIVANAHVKPGVAVNILDPACGDGELLLALTNELLLNGNAVNVVGRDIDAEAVASAKARFGARFPQISFRGEVSDFLDLKAPIENDELTLFSLSNEVPVELFDLIIANPPYVRTQHLGSERAKEIGLQFGLSGRVDLYQAFLAQFKNVLREEGSFGVIVPNRFLSTKSGESTRRLLMQNFYIDEIVDLGDTKLFEAAVLPALIFARKSTARAESLTLSSIYSTDSREGESTEVKSVFEPLATGASGRFNIGVEHWDLHRGKLLSAQMRSFSSPWIRRASDVDFLESVDSATWANFGSLGKIRVGIKTTADKVFIRENWGALEDTIRPEQELMFPLVNAKTATRWSCKHSELSVLYPYDMTESKRTPLAISEFPNAMRYLEKHRETLAGRKYVIEGGRQWWEIWVPQKPADWSRLKIVFPDISVEGRFALDRTGALVNGNCYWLPLNSEQEDLGYLAVAVANSSLAMKFYDARFGNKLYSGRRRFISQYVENFPLPDPAIEPSRRAIEIARQLEAGDGDLERLEAELDTCVWSAFGVEKA